MTLVSTLGRGAASGLASALVWVAVSVLFLGAPDPRAAAPSAAAVGGGLALAVVLVALLARLR